MSEMAIPDYPEPSPEEYEAHLLSQEELKSCPFCGGDAEYHDSHVANEDWGVVQCNDCGAKTEHLTLACIHAVTKWNRRKV